MIELSRITRNELPTERDTHSIETKSGSDTYPLIKGIICREPIGMPLTLRKQAPENRLVLFIWYRTCQHLLKALTLKVLFRFSFVFGKKFIQQRQSVPFFPPTSSRPPCSLSQLSFGNRVGQKFFHPYNTVICKH